MTSSSATLPLKHFPMSLRFPSYTDYTHFLDKVCGDISEVIVSDDGGVGLRAVELLKD